MFQRTQINFTVAIDFTSSNGKIALLFVLVFDKDLSNLQLIKPLLSPKSRKSLPFITIIVFKNPFIGILLKQGTGSEERARGPGKRNTGTKANLNLSPIRKFISNSLLKLFPFSLFRFPGPAFLLLVTSLSLLDQRMPMGKPFQMKRLWWNFYVVLFIS